MDRLGGSGGGEASAAAVGERGTEEVRVRSGGAGRGAEGSGAAGNAGNRGGGGEGAEAGGAVGAEGGESRRVEEDGRLGEEHLTLADDAGGNETATSSREVGHAKDIAGGRHGGGLRRTLHGGGGRRGFANRVLQMANMVRSGKNWQAKYGTFSRSWAELELELELEESALHQPSSSLP